MLEGKGQTAVVRVSVSRGELERGVTTAWLSLAGLALVLLLLAGLVADRMARSVTQPMNVLTDIARRLAAGDLDARSEVSGSAEVVDVSRALDTLAARIGELLQAERENAADVSHRLRTPLTALRLDAELLRDDEEKQRIMAAVDDLEKAVTTVIAETRRERSRSDRAVADLSEVVRERVAFWEVLARAQRRSLELRLHPSTLGVGARRHDLQQLVDVLVDNVLRHTPAGGAARVHNRAQVAGRRVSRRRGRGAGHTGARAAPTAGERSRTRDRAAHRARRGRERHGRSQ